MASSLTLGVVLSSSFTISKAPFSFPGSMSTTSSKEGCLGRKLGVITIVMIGSLTQQLTDALSKGAVIGGRGGNVRLRVTHNVWGGRM